MQNIPTNIKKSEIIIIDTETTGLDYHRKCLQLSIIDGTGKILFNEYFKPAHVKQWKDAQRINHISPDMVASCEHFTHYRKQVQKIFDNAKLVVGYNTAFDLVTLDLEKINVKRFFNEQWDMMPNAVDLMPAFAEIYGQWNEYHQNWKWQKLFTASAYYNYHWDASMHNSLADAYATKWVWEHMQAYGKISFDNVPNIYNAVLPSINERIQKLPFEITGYIQLKPDRTYSWVDLWEYFGHHPGYFEQHPECMPGYEITLYKWIIDALDEIDNIKNAPYCIRNLYERVLFTYNILAHPRAKNKYKYKPRATSVIGFDWDEIGTLCNELLQAPQDATPEQCRLIHTALDQLGKQPFDTDLMPLYNDMVQLDCIINKNEIVS